MLSHVNWWFPSFVSPSGKYKPFSSSDRDNVMRIAHSKLFLRHIYISEIQYMSCYYINAVVFANISKREIILIYLIGRSFKHRKSLYVHCVMYRRLRATWNDALIYILITWKTHPYAVPLYIINYPYCFLLLMHVARVIVTVWKLTFSFDDPWKRDNSVRLILFVINFIVWNISYLPFHYIYG